MKRRRTRSQGSSHEATPGATRSGSGRGGRGRSAKGKTSKGKIGRGRSGAGKPGKRRLDKGRPASAKWTGGKPGRGKRGRDLREPGAEAASSGCGWISIHPKGFGFVTLEEGGPDVFIPEQKRGTALHGDRVRVRAHASLRGREGRVVEVLSRGTRRLIGTLMRRRKRVWLEPEDPRLPRPTEVVGSVPLGIRPGDEVIASIESFPLHPRELLQARVLSGVPPRGSAASEIERILVREGVEEEFSEATLLEARALGLTPSRDELSGREDLRHLEFVTIDPEDARDHDDAVYAERLPRGAFRVFVAIADVSHYVQTGSALDRSALARGTSIYLPGRVIPMLPFELSSQLASLVPGEARLALVLEAELGARGAIRKSRYHEAVICSQARLTYAGVARSLSLVSEGPPQPEAESRRELLETLADAAAVVRRHRRQRGALEFELPESVIALDSAGEPEGISRARSNPGLRQAYGIVEDLMLLANETVATDLHRRGLPAIFRVHPPPDPERVERFAELAHSLGFELSEDAHEDPRQLAMLLRSVEGSEAAPALHYLLLRSMQQASYSVEDIGHFALAAPHYLHFTSPIRRYPDLAVHRIVRAVLARTRLDESSLRRELSQQASLSSRMERRAQGIDREITRLYAALLLRDRIGESFAATISSLDSNGMWIGFEDPFVEAYCPIENLGGYGYRLDPLGLHLEAKRSGIRWSVGQRVRVILEHVSVEDRILSVRLDPGTEATAGEEAATADASAAHERSPHRGRSRDAESRRGRSKDAEPGRGRGKDAKPRRGRNADAKRHGSRDADVEPRRAHASGERRGGFKGAKKLARGHPKGRAKRSR